MYDLYDDELTGLEEHERDSQYTGDPRRCPRHPHVKTSSDDGMFDAPCGECEADMAQAAFEWDHDPENPKRPYCGIGTYIAVEPRNMARCTDTDDDIPF